MEGEKNMTRKEHERALYAERRKTDWHRNQAKQAEEARFAVEQKLRMVRRALSRLVTEFNLQYISLGILDEVNAALDETKEYR